MWIELALAILAGCQMALLIFVVWQLQRLRRGMTAQEKSDGGVPAFLMIGTLNKIDHRLEALEGRLQQFAQQRHPAPLPLPPTAAAPLAPPTVPITSDYELAQHLAREGCDLDTVMRRCDLSRNEAELILRLYARQS